MTEKGEAISLRNYIHHKAKIWIMEKKWYIVYTKNDAELKVCDLLTKKKIQSYCPFTISDQRNGSKSRTLKQPLFKSYVFVLASKEDLLQIKHLSAVINLVYWLGKPATVSHEEIHVIKEFSNNHKNIQLEKSRVDSNGQVDIAISAMMRTNGIFSGTPTRKIRATLPSMGYVLTADIATTNVEVDPVIINAYTLNANVVGATN